MIHYALRCGGGHEFDGWFKDSANFDRQAGAGLVECPVCAGTQVERALMAPSVRKKANAAPAPAAPPGTAGVPATRLAAAPGPLPDQMLAALQKLRQAVESNCEYVGPAFAETARSMAEGDIAPRPIYGEATRAEESALEEDGVGFARIPWVGQAH